MLINVLMPDVQHAKWIKSALNFVPEKPVGLVDVPETNLFGVSCMERCQQTAFICSFESCREINKTNIDYQHWPASLIYILGPAYSGFVNESSSPGENVLEPKGITAAGFTVLRIVCARLPLATMFRWLHSEPLKCHLQSSVTRGAKQPKFENWRFPHG